MNSDRLSLSQKVTFLPDRSCLVSENEHIHLTPNERRLLELIISGRGKKETIIEEIWHSRGTIVGESSYHQLVKMLRRKLDCAGLPCSVIKTIPRYGLAFIPPEQTEEEKLMPPDSEQEENVSDEPAVGGTTEPGSELYVAIKPSNHDKNLIFSSPFSEYKRYLQCAAIFIVPLLLAIVYFIIDKPDAFPYQVKINNATVHMASMRNANQDKLALKKILLQKNIKHVYIASNGPKVWVAQCEGEMDKESKCHEELYSSY